MLMVLMHSVIRRTPNFSYPTRNNSWKCCSKWWGKQSHWDHFAGSRNFYYASRLRGDKFSKPWAPSESGGELYIPQVGDVTGDFCHRWFTCGQKDKPVTEKQAGTEFPFCPPPPDCGHSHRTTEPSWRSVTILSLQKAACGPLAREFKANSRHTVNPRKNNHIVSNKRTHWCKRSLLKVREEKFNRKHSGAQTACFCPSGAFITYHNLWKGEDQVIHFQ
jgi:hypothetical protein